MSALQIGKISPTTSRKTHNPIWMFLTIQLNKILISDNFQTTNILPNQITRQYQPENTELLMRKGVYPYEYMDSWDRFNE